MSSRYDWISPGSKLSADVRPHTHESDTKASYGFFHFTTFGCKNPHDDTRFELLIHDLVGTDVSNTHIEQLDDSSMTAESSVERLEAFPTLDACISKSANAADCGVEPKDIP
jgi:hypothetical protein